MPIIDCDTIITYGCFIPRNEWKTHVESLFHNGDIYDSHIAYELGTLCHIDDIKFEIVKEDETICAIYVYTHVKHDSCNDDSSSYIYKNSHDDLHHLSTPIDLSSLTYTMDNIIAATQCLTTASIKPQIRLLSYAYY